MDKAPWAWVSRTRSWISEPILWGLLPSGRPTIETTFRATRAAGVASGISASTITCAAESAMVTLSVSAVASAYFFARRKALRIHHIFPQRLFRKGANLSPDERKLVNIFNHIDLSTHYYSNLLPLPVSSQRDKIVSLISEGKIVWDVDIANGRRWAYHSGRDTDTYLANALAVAESHFGDEWGKSVAAMFGGDKHQLATELGKLFDTLHTQMTTSPAPLRPAMQ